MRETPKAGDVVLSPRHRESYVVTKVEEHSERGAGARRWVKVWAVNKVLHDLESAQPIPLDISHWFDGSQ